jgi:hypothetical protein
MREGNKSNVSQSIHSDINNESGHLIISLKFFKFVTDEDIHQEQRVYFNQQRK